MYCSACHCAWEWIFPHTKMGFLRKISLMLRKLHFSCLLQDGKAQKKCPWAGSCRTAVYNNRHGIFAVGFMWLKVNISTCAEYSDFFLLSPEMCSICLMNWSVELLILKCVSKVAQMNYSLKSPLPTVRREKGDELSCMCWPCRRWGSIHHLQLFKSSVWA